MKQIKNDEYYMSLAIKEALKAESFDEVPVGAVIVKDNKIIARGHNKREKEQSIISHAEINAIKKANKRLKSWRLEGCTIYVTLEPCIMCGGALIQSRCERIVYGASDPKGGAFGSSIDILKAENINWHPQISKGVLESTCSDILKSYFKKKRKSK